MDNIDQALTRIKELERSGRDIVHFEIGNPDFQTPGNIIDASWNALIDGFTHYLESMGDYNFREIIAENNLIYRGFKPDLNQIPAM